MNKKSFVTLALISLGIISQAGAQTTVVYLTGSTAFRGNVFTTLTTAGAVFDGAVTVVPAGASGSSGQIVYQGLIGGNHYAIDCSWTGSEAGIAAVDGLTSLDNGGRNLPGVPVFFPDPVTGASQTTTSTRPDLCFADTSQAVSLTRPPAHSALTEYNTVGVVPFVWLKGKNSSPSASWNHLANITQPQAFYVLGALLHASFVTGTSTDTDLIYPVGRNKGSGTRVNTLLDTAYYGVTTLVSQYGHNSAYQSSGEFKYTLVANDQAASYPAITGAASMTGIGNDGYDSGSGVANVLSCDTTGSGLITLGYAGIGDAKHARDGNAASGTTPAEPSGAIWLTLDGVAFNNGNVFEGTYSMWGHEHLYGQPGQSPTSPGGIVALKLAGVDGTSGALESSGGLGTSAANQDSALDYLSMNADKPGGGDTGYPSQ
jgi:hypothetical protein